MSERQAMAAMAMLAAMSISGPVERDYPEGTQRAPRCRIGTKSSKLPVSSRDRRREKKKSRQARNRNKSR